MAAVVGAALLAPLTLAAPARAADPARGEVTVSALKFTVDAGGKRCVVDADLHRPAGVDAEHPAPAVLTTNGFGGSKNDGATAAIARAFAERGYAVLAYSGLGFGKSGCPISLNDPRIDGKAASSLIDFLAGTRAADDGTRVDFVRSDGDGDPSVGMIGGSYGGSIQMATASQDRRVDALVPLITWNDLAYALDPNNTAQHSGVSSDTPGAYKYQWTNGFFVIGEAQGLLNPSLDLSRLGGSGCLHFVAEACETKRLLDTHTYPADRTARMLAYARSVSPVSYLHRVRTPTLLIQGQADTLFNLNESEATYKALKKQGTTTRMIWQSWGHSGGMTDPASGELNLGAGNLETSYVGRRILAWFDHYLWDNKGADLGPNLAYYRDWQPTEDAYATASEVPALSQKLYLSGDGKLVDNRSKVARGSREYRNRLWPTSHSENPVVNSIGLNDPAPSDGKGTYLGWTTEPLTEATDVVGAPRVTLKVVSPEAEKSQNSGDAADQLVLFAKLYDIAPDGTKTLVHRLIAPARVPDVTREFTVTLPGIVHRYEKGHRLQFVIAASDDAYYGNRGIKSVTVTSEPNDTGVLELPVVR
ncbi:CocE/NonD family hydrolase [Streptomyces sp. NPDC002851]